MSSCNKLFRHCLHATRQVIADRSISISPVLRLENSGSHAISRAFSTATKRSPSLKIDSDAARAHPNLYRIPTDPHIATARVSQLLERTSFNDAKEYLTNLRTGLQSTAAWNTLLKYCVAHGRGQLGESCFTEMRRRGFAPNERTYTLMILLWSKSRSPSSLDNAESWFDKVDKPTLFHYNALLRVYKDQGVSMEKALERLQSMPVVPDAVSYSTVLQCADAGDHSLVMDVWHRMDEQWQTATTAQHSNSRSEHSLLAQKAKRVSQIEQGLQGKEDKEEDKAPQFEMDDALQATMFSAMMRASCRPSFAMRVIERLYGIEPPPFSEDDTRYRPATDAVRKSSSMGLTPSVRTLDVMMRYFGTQKSYKLGRKYYTLMLSQFPKIKPDDQLKRTRAWLEPRKSVWTKRQGGNSN